MTEQHYYLNHYCGQSAPSPSLIRKQCRALVKAAERHGYQPKNAHPLMMPAVGVQPLPSPREYPDVRCCYQYSIGNELNDEGFYLRVDIKWQGD